MLPRHTTIDSQKGSAHRPHPKVHPAHRLELAHTSIDQWKPRHSLLPRLVVFELAGVQFVGVIPIVEFGIAILVGDFGMEI